MGLGWFWGRYVFKVWMNWGTASTVRFRVGLRVGIGWICDWVKVGFGWG